MGPHQIGRMHINETITIRRIENADLVRPFHDRRCSEIFLKCDITRRENDYTITPHSCSMLLY